MQFPIKLKLNVNILSTELCTNLLMIAVLLWFLKSANIYTFTDSFFQKKLLAFHRAMSNYTYHMSNVIDSIQLITAEKSKKNCDYLYMCQ